MFGVVVLWCIWLVNLLTKQKGKCMKQRGVKRFIVQVMVCLLASVVIGDEVEGRERRMLQLSLCPPLQLAPATADVRGLRLGIISVNNDVSGIDLGLVNWTSGDEIAFQWGFINKTTGHFSGIQWGMINMVNTGFVGWQSGMLNLTSGTSVGFFNGAGNMNWDSGVGFQLGFFNYSKSFTGLQFGLLNISHEMTGLQIGVLNIITSNPNVPVFPIINASF